MIYRTLCDVWLRGFIIVSLVSLNTRLLSDGRWVAVLVSIALSTVWWINARSASRVDGWKAACAYGVGAGCGSALGLWLGGL